MEAITHMTSRRLEWRPEEQVRGRKKIHTERGCIPHAHLRLLLLIRKQLVRKLISVIHQQWRVFMLYRHCKTQLKSCLSTLHLPGQRSDKSKPCAIKIKLKKNIKSWPSVLPSREPSVPTQRKWFPAWRVCGPEPQEKTKGGWKKRE